MKTLLVPQTSSQNLLIRLHMLEHALQLEEGAEEVEVILTMITEETTTTTTTTTTEDLEIITTIPEIIAEELIVTTEIQDTVEC